MKNRRKKDRWKSVWLALITGLWIWAAVSLSSQQGAIDEQLKSQATDRIEAGSQRCELIGTILDVLTESGGTQYATDLIRLKSQCEAQVSKYKADRRKIDEQ